jgi:hypothetical protein
MNDRAAEYRAKLDEMRHRGGKRWRTPPGLRDEITVWAKRLRTEGHVLGSIAATIGLSETTLGKWLSPGRGEGELRPVRLTADGTSPSRSGLVVVTPAGFRLEGLTVDEAVDVLRRL